VLLVGFIIRGFTLISVHCIRKRKIENEGRKPLRTGTWLFRYTTSKHYYVRLVC